MSKEERKNINGKTEESAGIRTMEAEVKLNCDIVKDLVPSYLENICSKSSEEAVEAHLAECADCCKYVENLRQTVIEGSRTNLKEMDYMKKFRRYYDKKLLVYLIGILMTAHTVLWCVKGTWNVESVVFEIAFPVITILFLFLLKDGKEYRETRMLRRILAALGLLGGAYILGIFGIFLNVIYTQKAPFGMEMFQVGSFLHRQIVIAAIGETAVFIVSLWDSMQKDFRMGITSVMALAVMTCAMAFHELLYHMDTFESAQALCWKILIIFGVEAIVLCGLTAVFSRPMESGVSRMKQ